MKLIFLDIDGVLNAHERADNGYYPILISKIDLLSKLLLAVPDAHIVLSSAWRQKLKTASAIETLLCMYGCHCHDRVHGCTECDELSHDGPLPLHGDIAAWSAMGLKLRANQIMKYVREHTPISWVAIDDLDLKLNNFIKTNPKLGLMEEDVQKAISILEAS
jgi:hypothetical protein